MSLKQHVITILGIIIAMIIFWRVFMSDPPPLPEDAPEQSVYSIEIIRASFAANCMQQRMPGDQDAPFAFEQSGNSPIRENNALVKVSQVCNGRVRCSLGVTPDMLGSDPAPNCFEKKLEVEYRCFNFDRPWLVVVKQGGTLGINCAKR